MAEASGSHRKNCNLLRSPLGFDKRCKKCFRINSRGDIVERFAGKRIFERVVVGFWLTVGREFATKKRSDFNNKYIESTWNSTRSVMAMRHWSGADLAEEHWASKHRTCFEH